MSHSDAAQQLAFLLIVPQRDELVPRAGTRNKTKSTESKRRHILTKVHRAIGRIETEIDEVFGSHQRAAIELHCMIMVAQWKIIQAAAIEGNEGVAEDRERSKIAELLTAQREGSLLIVQSIEIEIAYGCLDVIRDKQAVRWIENDAQPIMNHQG